MRSHVREHMKVISMKAGVCDARWTAPTTYSACVCFPFCFSVEFLNMCTLPVFHVRARPSAASKRKEENVILRTHVINAKTFLSTRRYSTSTCSETTFQVDDDGQR